MTIPVFDCPRWPKWSLSDSPALLERLGQGDIEFCDPLTLEWIECPKLYPHAIKTDAHLLLRRTDVVCDDFDTKLVLATRKDNTSSRLYMTNVRRSVAEKTAKRKGKSRALDVDESDGEVEIVADIC